MAWTRGAIEADPAILLREDGGPIVPLGRGRSAAKPDLEADGAGRWLAGYQLTVGGIGLDRVDGSALDGADLADAAAGNNSVDLAVRPDGSLVAAWFDEELPAGRYHAVAASPDLAVDPTDLLADLSDVAWVSPIPPDAAPAPDGGALVAWMDQLLDPDGVPDTLLVTKLASDGSITWTSTVDASTALAPRRPTVTVGPAGGIAVVYRRYEAERPETAQAWLASLGGDGSPIGAPVRLPCEGTDQPVSAALGDDALAVAWTADVGGTWTVELAIVALPSGDLLGGPLPLSDGPDATRPHLSAWDDGGTWTIGASWEDADGIGVARATW